MDEPTDLAKALRDSLRHARQERVNQIKSDPQVTAAFDTLRCAGVTPEMYAEWTTVDWRPNPERWVVECPAHGTATTYAIEPMGDGTDASEWADVAAGRHDAECSQRAPEVAADRTALDLGAAELTAVRTALRYATLRRPDLRAGIPPVLLP